MIVLEENKANKVPSETSLYLKLNTYSKTIFDTISRLDISIYDKKNNQFEISINNLFFVINMLTQYDDVKYIPYKKIENVSHETIGNIDFIAKPFNHQIEAIEYGLNHNSWMLLDECGLGKTLSMIYLAEVLQNKRGIQHCLIVCGVNSLKFNWLEEARKYSRLSAKVLGDRITRRGTHRVGSVAQRIEELKNPIEEFFVITNIETLQDKKFAEAFKNSANKFDMIVLDEAHRVKEPGNLSSKTMIKLDAQYKIALSGTIIVNAPENAYLPLKWIGSINSNYSNFKKLYDEFGGFGGHQFIGTKNLDLLKDIISHNSLRRKKSEVLDLPDISYSIEYVDMLPKQAKLYEEVRQEIMSGLDKLPYKPSVEEELTINLRLRQITASPSILSTEVTESAKLDRASEMIDDIVAQGDKVVVFCNFKETAYTLSDMIKDKYKHIVCTGDTDNSKIEVLKQEFQQDEDVKVAICTWQKMGTGHTLTAANYVIFIDTPYTDSDFTQSSERIYRIGQHKNAFVITLITKGTYDERVQEIIDNKEILSSYLVGEK